MGIGARIVRTGVIAAGAGVAAMTLGGCGGYSGVVADAGNLGTSLKTSEVRADLQPRYTECVTRTPDAGKFAGTINLALAPQTKSTVTTDVNAQATAQRDVSFNSCMAKASDATYQVFRNTKGASDLLKADVKVVKGSEDVYNERSSAASQADRAAVADATRAVRADVAQNNPEGQAFAKRASNASDGWNAANGVIAGANSVGNNADTAAFAWSAYNNPQPGDNLKNLYTAAVNEENTARVAAQNFDYTSSSANSQLKNNGFSDVQIKNYLNGDAWWASMDGMRRDADLTAGSADTVRSQMTSIRDTANRGLDTLATNTTNTAMGQVRAG